MKIYILSKTKLYSNNMKNNYRPEGSMDYPNSSNKRNPDSVAWIKVGTEDMPVNSFKIDSTGIYHQTDHLVVKRHSKSLGLSRDYMLGRLADCINDLKKGNVFKDGSSSLAKDRDTHYLGKQSKKYHNDGNALVFSKDLDNEHRLTYTVHRPDSTNTSKVELNNFIGHSYNNKPYGESNSAISTSNWLGNLARFRFNETPGRRIN